MSITEDADYAKHHSFAYPTMIFKNLRIADDAELLKPIVMLIYAITMNDTNSMPLAQFEETRVHENGLQYELKANVPETVTIGHRAWNALQTVSPSRVMSVHVQPYYDVEMDAAYMRILVTVLSVMAPLGRSFDTYMRKDRSFLVPLRHQQPNSGALVASSAKQQQQEERQGMPREALAQEVRRACRKMTRFTEGYDFDRNFFVDLPSMCMTWALPCEQMLDVDCVPLLMTQFAEHIKDVHVGVRVKRDNALGYRPMMQIVVNISMVAHDQESAILIDTQTMLYFSDSSTQANQEPWYFEASGPGVDLGATDSSSASTSSSSSSSASHGRGGRMATRSSTRKDDSKSSVRPSSMRLHSMTRLAKRPVNKKRKRPSAFETDEYDGADEEDESSVHSESESFHEPLFDDSSPPTLTLMDLQASMVDTPSSPARSDKSRPRKRQRLDDDDERSINSEIRDQDRSSPPRTTLVTTSWFGRVGSLFGF